MYVLNVTSSTSLVLTSLLSQILLAAFSQEFLPLYPSFSPASAISLVGPSCSLAGSAASSAFWRKAGTRNDARGLQHTCWVLNTFSPHAPQCITLCGRHDKSALLHELHLTIPILNPPFKLFNPNLTHLATPPNASQSSLTYFPSPPVCCNCPKTAPAILFTMVGFTAMVVI